MPRVCYQDKNFQRKTLAVIAAANAIIDEYAAQGFRLTLRQLYYQFVARDLLPNEQRQYKRLGSIVSDGRLAGLIDWHAIEDRTRNLKSLSHWEDPAEIIDGAADSYAVDKWEDQPCRIEVWIEKEALAGVFQGVCEELDVPFFSCRGYTSQSEMWSAAQRLRIYQREGQDPVVLHFGDHDPSGIDMTRDIRERLELFGAYVHVHRLALNRDQVDEHRPPPNPAKVTDSRFEAYLLAHGAQSWELDALEPQVLTDIVRARVENLRDDRLWNLAVAREEQGTELLERAAGRWHDVVELLEETS